MIRKIDVKVAWKLNQESGYFHLWLLFGGLGFIAKRPSILGFFQGLQAKFPYVGILLTYILELFFVNGYSIVQCYSDLQIHTCSAQICSNFLRFSLYLEGYIPIPLFGYALYTDTPRKLKSRGNINGYLLVSVKWKPSTFSSVLDKMAHPFLLSPSQEVSIWITQN